MLIRSLTKTSNSERLWCEIQLVVPVARNCNQTTILSIKKWYKQYWTKERLIMSSVMIKTESQVHHVRRAATQFWAMWLKTWGSRFICKIKTPNQAAPWWLRLRPLAAQRTSIIMNLSLLHNIEDRRCGAGAVWKSVANGSVEGLARKSWIVGVTFVDAAPTDSWLCCIKPKTRL